MSKKNKNIAYTESVKNEVVDAGITVGRIRSAVMGTEYTTLQIAENLHSIELTHTVIVKSEIAQRMRIGASVAVKLELWEPLA